MRQRILVIEDELGLLLALQDRLTSEGYAVSTAGDGINGLELAANEVFDLILLDLMIPEKNGLDVCRDLRQRKISTPIIMLTARGQIYDKVLGLKIGADDYLTKPFDMAELLARVEAQLRRTTTAAISATDDSESYRFGSILVDFQKTEVMRGGEKIELSAREFKLLEYIIKCRGKVLTRNQILDDVWGRDVNVSTRTVDVHIAWLRQKLEENARHPQFIQTIHGLGYKFIG